MPSRPGQTNLQCDRTEGEVDAAVSIGPKYGRAEDFSYAFYLYADGKKAAARGYQKSPNVRFEGSRPKSNLTVVAYLRDQLGSVRSITRKLSAVATAWVAATFGLAGEFANEAETIIEQAQLLL